MTKQNHDKLKHHLIHTIMTWIEQNGGGKNQTADVLCELSKEMRSGNGPIFDDAERTEPEGPVAAIFTMSGYKETSDGSVESTIPWVTQIKETISRGHKSIALEGDEDEVMVFFEDVRKNLAVCKMLLRCNNTELTELPSTDISVVNKDAFESDFECIPHISELLRMYQENNSITLTGYGWEQLLESTLDRLKALNIFLGRGW